MTKFEDFKGEISVDFEGSTSQASKIKEFFNIDLHPDDFIIRIKFSAGEYHHSQKNETSKFLTFFVVNMVDLDKPEEDRKIKEVSVRCENYEQFFAFFKRVEINLNPFHHRATS